MFQLLISSKLWVTNRKITEKLLEPFFLGQANFAFSVFLKQTEPKHQTYIFRRSVRSPPGFRRLPVRGAHRKFTRPLTAFPEYLQISPPAAAAVAGARPPAPSWKSRGSTGLVRFPGVRSEGRDESAWPGVVRPDRASTCCGACGGVGWRRGAHVCSFNVEGDLEWKIGGVK